MQQRFSNTRQFFWCIQEALSGKKIAIFTAKPKFIKKSIKNMIKYYDINTLKVKAKKDSVTIKLKK